MKLIQYIGLAAVVCFAASLSGCANQTTDPHQGGLFSYNPQAYDKRLQDRQTNLEQIDNSTKGMQQQASGLEADKSAAAREQDAWKKDLTDLSLATASLERKIKAKKAATKVQKKERDRILTELSSLQASGKSLDDVHDPEERRLELEQLRKKREQLEMEAESLMLL